MNYELILSFRYVSFLCHLGTGLAHTRREEPWARGVQFCRPEVGGDALVRQLFAEFFPDLADYEETAGLAWREGTLHILL